MRRFVLTFLFFIFGFKTADAMMCTDFLTKIEKTSPHRLIEKSQKNLDAMRELGLVNEKQYRHYKEDLLAGKDQIDKKQGHEVFAEILKRWELFLDRSSDVVEEYRKMSPSDKKKWKEKINLVLFFSVGHFVTFLESDKKNVYQKTKSILDHMNALPSDVASLVFLFEFEKQVMRFFSLKEFRRCAF